MKREKVRRQIRRAAAEAAALLLAAAFSLPAGTEIMGVRLGNAIVASAAYSGSFGENLHWELDNTGKLTIQGYGAMPEWSAPPWNGYVSDITSVQIEKGVTSIGNFAFSGCTNLTSITIPSGVTSIGNYAFNRCSSLTGITIPDSVTSIGDFFVFADCNSLTNITVDDDNLNYSSEDGVLFNKTKTTLIQYPISKSGESYVIPDGVKSIGNGAISNCSGLTSITIPDSVSSIGMQAFGNCTGLTSITIPGNVTSIGSETFRNCSNLTSIFLPEGLNVSNASIPASAAQVKYTVDGDNATVTDIAMGSQPSLTIPDTIGGKTVTAVFIEDGKNVTAPAAATQIKYTVSGGKVTINGTTAGTAPLSLAIPEKIGGNDVTAIADSAFVGCTSLQSITIPKSVNSIGNYAFDTCYGLTGITVDNNNPYYSSTDGVLFNKDKTTLIRYPASKSGDSYSIPSEVDSIRDCAFYGCGSLTSIDIPDSVTSIGDKAFWNCDSLTSIFLPEGAIVGIDAIPAAAAQVRYTVVDDGVFLINDVNLNGQTSVNFPDTIGGKTVTAVFIEDGTTGVNVPTSATQIKYTVSDGKVTINGTTAGTAPLSLAIPEKIGGNDVTAIGDQAFIRVQASKA